MDSGERPGMGKQGMGKQAGADREARLEREAAALRANLRRRKAQGRARGAADVAQETELGDGPRSDHETSS